MTARGDDEDFGVRLEWPADPVGEPFEPPAAPPAPEPAPVVPPPPERVPPPPPPPPPSPSLLEGLISEVPDDFAGALAAVAARVDSLTAVTVTFRDFLSSRMHETSERVLAAALAGAENAQRALRLTEQTGADFRRTFEALDSAVERLAGVVDELTAEVAAQHKELASTVADLAEEVRVLRRRTTVRGRSAAIDESQLQEIIEGVTRAIGSPASEVAERRPRRRA